MEHLVVRHEGGDRFTVDVRGHRVTVDQPVAQGGGDAGPTPTELFVAGLVSCVAFYARRYLARHQLPEDGLEVTGKYSFGSRPARVDVVRIRVTLPDGVPADRREPLLKVASHCTVHNSLEQPPSVEIELAPPPGAAAPAADGAA